MVVAVTLWVNSPLKEASIPRSPSVVSLSSISACTPSTTRAHMIKISARLKANGELILEIKMENSYSSMFD